MTLSLALGPGFAPPGVAQSPSPEIGHGSFYGTLFQADEKTALVGARVIAINVRTTKQYSGEVTTRNGEYLVDGVPGGSYDLVVEVGGDLFLVDSVIDILPNEGLSISFAVQPERPAARTTSGVTKPKGSATTVGVPTSAVSAFWRTPGGIALLSVFGAGAVAVLIHNSGQGDKGSPSAP